MHRGIKDGFVEFTVTENAENINGGMTRRAA